MFANDWAWSRKKIDQIIFKNGDTIYGDVIAVAVKEVIYRYKDEDVNNVVRKSVLVKINHATGRTQSFVIADEKYGWDYGVAILLSGIGTVFLTFLVLFD